MRIHLAETSQTGGAVGFGKESPSDHVQISGSARSHPVLRPEAEDPVIAAKQRTQDHWLSENAVASILAFPAS